MEIFPKKFEHGVSMLAWAYNEEKTVEAFLTKAITLLEATVEDFEIVLVDDGSIDRTYEIARRFQEQNPRLKIIRNLENLNVGKTIPKAIKNASKEFLFWQTVDWCYDISDLRKNLEYLKTYDIVQGVRRNPVAVKSRFVRPLAAVLRLFGAKHLTKRSDTIFKAVVSVINYTLIRLLFSVPCSDFQNVSFYRTSWIQSISFESNSAFTNPEALIKSYWTGKTVIEVPISFIPRKEGKAKGTRVKAIFNAVRDVFSLWIKWVLQGKRGEVKRGMVKRLYFE